MFHNAETYDTFPTVYVQPGTLTIFLFFCWVASRDLNPLKKLATVAGSSMFIISILYVLMMFAASVINPNGNFVTPDSSQDNVFPRLNLQYFTSLSILVFAVDDREKISPYVNKVENPGKGFPKGMTTLATMVVIYAILDTIAMGVMSNPAVINRTQESLNSYVSNGSRWAFQKLGGYYHIGDALLIVYALCNMIGQFSTPILSIDTPLRTLLDNEGAREFIPSGLFKENRYGAYISRVWMVAIPSEDIILIQSFVSSAVSVPAQLNELNFVTMPMRYLWVFAAYVALHTARNEFQPEYQFVKNQGIVMTFGIWCFILTVACYIMSMYTPGDMLTTVLNVITSVVLIALGMVLPVIKKNEKA